MSVDVKTWKKINVLLSLCFGGVGKRKKELKAWRSGRVADCSPVGRRFAPVPPLLLTLALSN